MFNNSELLTWFWQKCHIVICNIVHFVELVNRVGSDQHRLLTSKVLPLVWHLLEIQTNQMSSVGQLRQPTAELLESISAQLDDDICSYAHDRLSSPAYELLDELMGNLQWRYSARGTCAVHTIMYVCEVSSCEILAKEDAWKLYELKLTRAVHGSELFGRPVHFLSRPGPFKQLNV